MRSAFLAAALTAAVLALGVNGALATPSGLNNIPTADTADANVLVLQAFSESGPDREANWFAGCEYGLAAGWEVGIDDLFAGPGSASGPTLQAKYRIALNAGKAVAFGAANISNDSDRNGEIFPYAVMTVPLGKIRGHFGYSAQRDNNAWFVGADGAVGRATLRADWTQVADGDESMSSVGFIAPLSARWLIEGWASFPTAAGADTSYIVKLDFVVPMAAGK